MGGGGSTSSTAAPNPVTQPAMQGASEAVQSVQNQLPMGLFTNWSPNAVAGIAPLQQAAMQAAVAGLQAPTGLDSLMRMQNPLAMIASNQFDMARANPMMEQIMGRLGFAGGSQVPMNTGADLASQIPGAAQANLYTGFAPPDASAITTSAPLLMPSATPFNRPDNAWASPLQEQMARLQASLDGA